MLSCGKICLLWFKRGELGVHSTFLAPNSINAFRPIGGGVTYWRISEKRRCFDTAINRNSERQDSSCKCWFSFVTLSRWSNEYMGREHITNRKVGNTYKILVKKCGRRINFRLTKSRLKENIEANLCKIGCNNDGIYLTSIKSSVTNPCEAW